MNGRKQSDPAIVAARSPNEAGQPVKEATEPRAGAKENANQHNTHRTLSRERVTHALDRVRERARLKKKEKFTALLHHINPDTLKLAFYALKRDAAPGADGMTWEEYEQNLDVRLEELHGRVHRGAYRPQPSRRVYIPKADGSQRPLAIAALEDKIVQGATVMVLNSIYEEDFLGFSYGFRPGRGPHDAMDALAMGIVSRRVNFILDADIRSFFDSVSQEWLIRFIEHRIGDKRVIRLIRKWLKAGVLEDGIVNVSDRGTGQGSVISPLLANIYLHYVIDLWAERSRRREAQGDIIIVRYADDVIVGCEHEAAAHRFLDALRVRLEEFALALHPDKTRLIAFGRFAAERRRQRGLGKPETFNFLGFTYICTRAGNGKFLIRRKSRRDRVRAKLQEIKKELGRCMHADIADQGKWLRQVVTGFFNYHAVPTNSRTIAAFRNHVLDLWRRTLKRRGQKDRTTEANDEAGGRLAPQTTHPSSLADPALYRQTSKVGAVCGKIARTVLCGGRVAIRVPTAIRTSLVAPINARGRGSKPAPAAVKATAADQQHDKQDHKQGLDTHVHVLRVAAGWRIDTCVCTPTPVKTREASFGCERASWLPLCDRTAKRVTILTVAR